MGFRNNARTNESFWFVITTSIVLLFLKTPAEAQDLAPDDCLDRSLLCVRWRMFCNDESFIEFMRLNCPRICGLCPDIALEDRRTSQLTGRRIKNATYATIDFSGSRFDGTDLRGSMFFTSNLTQCNFNGADFRGSTFSNCYLNRSTFHGANFNGATFINCACTSCEFDGAKFKASTFSEVTLARSSFEGSTFRSASFVDTDFSSTKLTRADFNDSTLLTRTFDAGVRDIDLTALAIEPF